MKRKKLISCILAASLLASSSLVGCGQKTGDKGGDTSAAKVDKEQYINCNLGAEPKTLDPSKGTDIYAAWILAETMEGLTRLEQEDGKDVVKAAGAEKWEHNEDGTVWKFYLRDYNWSDGKKVTAEDFIYSVKRTLDPKTGAPYANLLYVIKNGAAINEGKAPLDSLGMKALDEKTLEITLESPCPYFFQITYNKTFVPQRKDIVEKYGDKYGAEPDTMVYCGPFNIKSWTHNSEMVLEKSDKYWDKKSVKLEKVNMKIIKDESAAYNSLYSGSLDLGGVSKKEWIEKFDKTGKFNNLQGYKPGASYIFFNTKDKLFKNANVRKAFSIGVTRDDLCDVIFKGRQKPAYGWVPPTVLVNDKEFRAEADEPIKNLIKENQDPKELLSKGLKELGMDPDPSKLTVTFLQAGTDQWFRTYAEYLQEMYKKTLGITLKTEYVEWPVFQKKTDEGKFELASMSMSGDYNDPNTFFDGFISATAYVPTFWKNEEYDKLTTEAQNIMDVAKRLDNYKKAEKILLYDDAVIAPTGFPTRNTYVYKYVKNLMTPLFGTTELKYTYTDGRSK
ncbi:peptide ABC transporter substrate-binding protein [Haloimpatiens lingqiaonensis]|uniref:peptide ABC transporter substrate-binding protein n=1 Tax=Haloimpatiens lingqiaonensis TaxID=1380675 RepID=UPI0010FD9488|nr:peptide ABC transporter substrate-binding protein [Haloimpatiens lingqiaonensis]